MSDNVTPLPGIELPTNRLELMEEPLRYCEHDQVRVDGHRRVVCCVKCGAVLDPFDFVVHNAKTISWAWRDYRTARRQLAELATRVDDLKREEKRLKALVKRLRDRAGEVLDVRGRDG